MKDRSLARYVHHLGNYLIFESAQMIHKETNASSVNVFLHR